MKERILDTAWLYVARDGTEHWHKPSKPDGPALLVDVVYYRRKCFEQTYTRLSYSVADVVAHHAFIVKPRGEKWVMVGIQGTLVLWRRPHNTDGRWPDGPPLILNAPREEIA